MVAHASRRTAALAVLLATLAVLPAVTANAAAPPRYEIWALDQGAGLNRVHVYDPKLQEVATVELNGLVDTPHMIDFDSQQRYAFIAATRSGSVAVVRADDKQVAAVLPTGATAHMAAVTPDDRAVWVANIGARTLVEIVPDWDGGSFSLGRTINLFTDPLYQATYGSWPAPPGPVCHAYTPDSRFAYVTLGPAAGGLVVVDLEAGRIVRAFDPNTVRANCGTAPSADGTRLVANWGSPTQLEGEWYEFDTRTHEQIGSSHGSGGVDAHGARFQPLHSGGRLLWMLNRGSDNGIVVDTATNTVVRELPFVGDAPDIFDFAPDGSRVFVALRGPSPRSGDPHVATGSTPGFAVLHGTTGRILEIVRPAGDNPASDFHGIAVRPLRPAGR